MCLRSVSENNKEESNGFIVRGSHWQGKKDLEEGFWLVEGQFIKTEPVLVAQLPVLLNKHRGRFLDYGSSRKAFEVLRVQTLQNRPSTLMTAGSKHHSRG